MKPLIPCPSCGRPMAKSARACPTCGHRYDHLGLVAKIVIAVTVLLTFAAIYGIVTA